MSAGFYAELYTAKAQECGRLAAHAQTPGEVEALVRKGAEQTRLAELESTAPPPRISEPISFMPVDGDDDPPLQLS